jgi:Domain of unknown function (DUF5658)
MTGIVAPQPHMLIASGGTRQSANTAHLTRFGNWAIVLFLVMQGLDGVFTYVGLAVYGPSIEANPLLGWLMHSFGTGPALAGAKLTAAGLGILLHLVAVHRAVALLTLLYACAAILPWTHVLFLQH